MTVQAEAAEGGCGITHVDRNVMGTEDPDVVSIKAPPSTPLVRREDGC